jgi:acyl-CoA synthetase (AMP-forming)/AMP-acid ligase II
VLDYLRANLATYKIPKRVTLTPVLPRSPAGKILRRALATEVSP